MSKIIRVGRITGSDLVTLNSNLLRFTDAQAFVSPPVIENIVTEDSNFYLATMLYEDSSAVDTEALDTAHDAAAALEEATYTPASWEAFTALLAKADAAYADKAYIDQLNADLLTAVYTYAVTLLVNA